MAKKSKLKVALDAYEAKDYKLEHQKKLRKQAARLKRKSTVEDEPEYVDNDEGEGGVKLDGGAESTNSLNALDHDGTDSDPEEAQQLVLYSNLTAYLARLTILK